MPGARGREGPGIGISCQKALLSQERSFRAVALILLAAIFWVWGSFAPALAGGMDVTKIPKPSVLPFLSQEEFNKITKEIVESKPYGDEQLAYTIRIPKNWIGNSSSPTVGEMQGRISVDILGGLAKYIGAPKNLLRSYITVEAQQLGYEISAQNWFVNFILGNGFSLISLVERSPRDMESAYVQVIDDQSYVVRSRVLINGSKLIMIRYYLPQENYAEEKVQQAQVLAGFQLMRPTGKRIEHHDVYAFIDQSYFDYPDSWTLRESKDLTIERMDVLLFQQTKDGRSGTLDGQIKVNVISKLLDTTLAKEIGLFGKTFKVDGYSVGSLIGRDRYKHDPSVKTSKTEFYKLIPADSVNKKDYELAVSALEGEDYYYIISLVTPAREENFYAWARNVEVFRIVSETIRRHE